MGVAVWAVCVPARGVEEVWKKCGWRCGVTIEVGADAGQTRNEGQKHFSIESTPVYCLLSISAEMVGYGPGMGSERRRHRWRTGKRGAGPFDATDRPRRFNLFFFSGTRTLSFEVVQGRRQPSCVRRRRGEGEDLVESWLRMRNGVFGGYLRIFEDVCEDIPSRLLEELADWKIATGEYLVLVLNKLFPPTPRLQQRSTKSGPGMTRLRQVSPSRVQKSTHLPLHSTPLPVIT